MNGPFPMAMLNNQRVICPKVGTSWGAQIPDRKCPALAWGIVRSWPTHFRPCFFLMGIQPTEMGIYPGKAVTEPAKIRTNDDKVDYSYKCEWFSYAFESFIMYE